MFRGRLDFCSNFYPVKFKWADQIWWSSENAFQWSKIPASKHSEKVKSIFSKSSAAESKYLGRVVKLRIDWNTARLANMESILYQKFNPDNGLWDLLKSTGDEELIEWNTWGDKFWGKDINTGEGENNLGKILMKIRDSI